MGKANKLCVNCVIFFCVKLCKHLSVCVVVQSKHIFVFMLFLQTNKQAVLKTGLCH